MQHQRADDRIGGGRFERQIVGQPGLPPHAVCAAPGLRKREDLGITIDGDDRDVRTAWASEIASVPVPAPTSTTRPFAGTVFSTRRRTSGRQCFSRIVRLRR